MFKSLCDLNNLESVKVFASLEEFFDPRINNFFSADLTLKQYHEWRRTLFSKENLESLIDGLIYFRHYQHSMRGSPSYPLGTNVTNFSKAEIFKACFDNIPENRLWILQYIGLEHHIALNNAYSTLCVSFPTNPKLYQRHNKIFYENSDIDSITFFNIESFSTWLSNFWKLFNDYEEFVKDFGNKVAFPLFRGAFTALGRVFVYMRSYTFCSSFCDSEDDSYHAASLKRFLEINPEAIITCQNGNGGSVNYFNVRVVVPKTSKSAHYRVYPYNTNIVAAMGLVIPNDRKLRLGVELELSTNYTPKEIINAQDELFFLVKEDSSIDGDKDNEYECVTRPMSYKEQKLAWAKWFKKIDLEEFDTSRYTNNGMHVHMTKSAFTSKHMRMFTWFLTNPANADFVLLVSERDEDSFASYAALPDYSIFRRKGSCIKNSEAAAARLRGLINVRGAQTIEVRMFKGIVSFATVLKNLEFVIAAYDYTKDLSYEKCSCADFLEWLKTTPKNKFVALKKFFEVTSRELKKIAEESKITYICFDAEQEDILEKTLKMRKIELNQTVVDLINKKAGYPKFEIYDGKLIINSKNKAKLHRYDEEMLSRFVRAA